MSKSRQDQDDDIKSGPSSMKNEHDSDEGVQDYELHSKKDAPPRFSTIFETKSAPAPAPIPVEHYIEAPRRRERGGIFLTWPIVILLIVIFLFETIIIFAYTSIGLYNQLSGFTGRSQTFIGHTGTSACDLSPQYQAAAAPPINFSPNIVVGAVDHATTSTETVTLFNNMPLPLHLSTTPISSTISSSSSSPSSFMVSSSISSSAGPVVTVTPGGIATSVVFVTASLESTSDTPRPTSFVTVIAGQSTTSSKTAISVSTSSTTVASTSASTSSSSSLTTTSSSSTTSTTPTSTTTVPPTSTTETSEAHGTNPAFIGGLGGTGGH